MPKLGGATIRGPSPCRHLDFPHAPPIRPVPVPVSVPVPVPVLVLVLSSVLSAQSGSSPIGVYGSGSSGKGGFVPRAWVAGQPSLGSQSLALTLDRGLGGALTGMFLSTSPADFPFLNFRLLVNLNPTNSLLGYVGRLGGSAGTAGAGSAQLPAQVPSTPALVDSSFYFQWLVGDSSSASGLVASQGLRVTLSQGPLVLAAGSNTFIEYVPGNTSVNPIAVAGNVTDVQMNPSGTMAFSAASSNLLIHDLTSKPYKLLASTPLSSTANCLAVHPGGERAYVIVPHASNPRIEAVDIRKGSASFGKIVATVQGLPSTGLGDMEGASISANGKVLAVVPLGLLSAKSVLSIDPLGRFLVTANANSKDLTVIDLRSGPGYFTARALPKAPVGFFSVALTPDASQAIAVGQYSGGDIYAYDISSSKIAWSVKSATKGTCIAVR